MSWLKKLFTGNKEVGNTEQKKEVQKEDNSFLTNSGSFPIGHITLGNTGKLRIDAILAMAQLGKIAEKRDLVFSQEVMYTTLVDGGAITVPLVTKMGEEFYAVYFIYNDEELGKYKHLASNFHKTKFTDLVYFSALPLNKEVPTNKIIEPLQLADLPFDRDIETSGDFAVWWTTSQDPVFHKSLTYDYLLKLNQIFLLYGTFLHGYVLRQVRVNQDEQIKRILFPSEKSQYGLKGPDNVNIILEVSEAKGIRFYFPKSSTSQEYREQVLKSILVDFLANFVELKQLKFEVDQKENVAFCERIERGLGLVKEQELSGDPLKSYGEINEADHELLINDIGVPTWSGFESKQDFVFFIGRIRDYFESKKLKIEINDGVVNVLNEGFGVNKLGLQNLAQVCNGISREQYDGNIIRHFDQMIEAHSNQAAFDKQKVNFDFAREFLSIRIHHETFAKMTKEAGKVSNLIGGDIYSLLCFDLPTTIVSTSASDLSDWGRSYQDLYQIGLDNAFEKYDFPIKDVDIHGIGFLVSEADHFFIPNTILDLKNRPDLVGKGGTLIAIPNRSLLIMYRIDSLEVIAALNAMIPVTIQLNLKGPGAVSDKILWYYEGAFENFEYASEEEKLSVKPSKRFIEILESLK